MRLDALDYAYDPELVAQTPLPERDGARLLVLPGPEGGVLHRQVRDLVSLLPPALWVVNDTRVLPARLLGTKAGTGGRVEIFLIKRVADEDRGDETWLALGRASKGLRAGSEVVFGERPVLRATVTERHADGTLSVRLRSDDVREAIDTIGRVPLPPYIRREPTDLDANRYQTVFAEHGGAVAAPTAGLHLSNSLLDALRGVGHRVESVTLHVGLGTFGQVSVPDLDEHPMHQEEYAVPEDTVTAFEVARAAGQPVVAVGTTVVRALESAALHAANAGRAGTLLPVREVTDLLIQPGFTFRAVDVLFTNFHQPRSTLLALVMAFGGVDPVRAAYEEAVAARYRLFSYGDAMLIRGGKTHAV